MDWRNKPGVLPKRKRKMKVSDLMKNGQQPAATKKPINAADTTGTYESTLKDRKGYSKLGTGDRTYWKKAASKLDAQTKAANQNAARQTKSIQDTVGNNSYDAAKSKLLKRGVNKKYADDLIKSYKKRHRR